MTRVRDIKGMWKIWKTCQNNPHQVQTKPNPTQPNSAQSTPSQTQHTPNPLQAQSQASPTPAQPQTQPTSPAKIPTWSGGGDAVLLLWCGCVCVELVVLVLFVLFVWWWWPAGGGVVSELLILWWWALVLRRGAVLLLFAVVWLWCVSCFLAGAPQHLVAEVRNSRPAPDLLPGFPFLPLKWLQLVVCSV